jgi:hypothetical protein
MIKGRRRGGVRKKRARGAPFIGRVERAGWWAHGGGERSRERSCRQLGASEA